MKQEQRDHIYVTYRWVSVNERLEAKTDGSTRHAYTWVARGTGTPKDRDEVKMGFSENNKREKKKRRVGFGRDKQTSCHNLNIAKDPK